MGRNRHQSTKHLGPASSTVLMSPAWGAKSRQACLQHWNKIIRISNSTIFNNEYCFINKTLFRFFIYPYIYPILGGTANNIFYCELIVEKSALTILLSFFLTANILSGLFIHVFLPALDPLQACSALILLRKAS